MRVEAEHRCSSHPALPTIIAACNLTGHKLWCPNHGLKASPTHSSQIDASSERWFIGSLPIAACTAFLKGLSVLITNGQVQELHVFHTK